MEFTAGVDIGGTFTDGYFMLGDRSAMTKVLTTHHDLSDCFLNCLATGAALLESNLSHCLAQATAIRLSTTLGTNILLELNGPPVGLIVTAGEESSLYHDDSAEVPPLLRDILRSDLVVGIEESISAQGEPTTAPSPEEVLAAVRRLVSGGARRIGVCLRHGGSNPAHENAVRRQIRDTYPEHYLRSVPVQLAHALTLGLDDRSRVATAAVNAYLHNSVAAGLYRSESITRDHGLRRPLLVSHADGGCARVAKTIAVQTLSSGPAAAVAGSAEWSVRTGCGPALIADIGGTSLDFSVVSSDSATINRAPWFMGVPLGIGMLETTSIAAGGGSIARLEGGAVAVGPRSAGSTPGPACFGKGGDQPTVTDANVVLGLIDSDRALGGRINLSRDLAESALLDRIGSELGLDALAAARLVRSTVDDLMAAALAAALSEAGVVGADASLLALGGGGPLHACAIADRVGIRRVIGFPYGPVFSAHACCTLDLHQNHLARLSIGAAEPDLADRVAKAGRRLHRTAVDEIAGLGLDAGTPRSEWELMTSADSGVEEVGDRDGVPDPDDVARWQARSTAGERLIGVALRASVPMGLQPLRRPAGSAPAPARRQTIDWPDVDGAVDTPTYDADQLSAGVEIIGPAAIDSLHSRWLVPHNWRAVVDDSGTLTMTRTD